MEKVMNNDIVAARRSMMRLYKQIFPNFDKFEMEILKENWGMMWLQHHYTNSSYIRRKWFASEAFQTWVSNQFDLRNYELLMQCGYGIHFTERLADVTLYEFKDRHDECHVAAILKIHPGAHVIQLIESECQ